MREHAIFFDLDDTLYDRSEPFKKTFLHFYPEEAGIARKAYWACEKRGNEVFLPSQRGEITMEEMYIYRYQKGLRDVGLSISQEKALEFQSVYAQMQKQITLGEGVEVLLDFCCENFWKVGLITNGPALKQEGKLRTMQLDRWIPTELTLISGVVKIDKPDPAIFHMAEKRAGARPEQIIYVGDSLANDIRPSHALGWKTIYLNKKSIELGLDEIQPNLVLDGDEVLTPDHLKALFS